MPAWFECDTRCLPAQGQPAALLDLCLQRGINSHRLLRGTGLFLEDMQRPGTLLSAQQLLRLTDNARQLLDADDSAFLLGQRLLPGTLGAASHALSLAGNLQQALELLCELRPLLSPLLSPRLLLDNQYLWLHWQDSCGLGQQTLFMLEASMAAVVSMSRRLGGEQLPWQFYLRHPQPRYVEQYWVHLGEHLHFGSPCNLMRLPRTYLDRHWGSNAATSALLTHQQARAELQQLPARHSLLDALYHWLQRHVREAPGLECAAAAFHCSPATFKRKLKKHGTHYQQQLDQVRLHTALYLYQVRGYSNDDVASYLHFHDATNLRRSFKRWTGMAPRMLLEALSGA
jgi:AraC-like DNA-binding protein